MNQAKPHIAPPARRRNRLMRLAGTGQLVIFLLWMLSRLILQNGRGGRSDPPIFDLLAVLGFGLCTLAMAGCYLYYSWTQDAAG